MAHKRVLVVALALSLLIVSCVTPDGRGPDGRVAMETFGRGVLNLVLSPVMIVAGIAQGIAFLPYTVGMGLSELNRALLQANAVSLDDSYKATFGVSITDRQVHQKTGDVYGQEGLYGRYKAEALPAANQAFQRLLVSQGMSEETARTYVLVGNYSHAWSRGQILLAVVRRDAGNQPFRASGKKTNIATTFRPDQRGWYEAYERDVDGRPLDEVIDWAAMEYPLLRQDKVVATLMVLAAEAVKADKRAPDYWMAERRWLAGDTNTVVQESVEKVRRALPSSTSAASD